jgi:anti-anti-sigma regulatory factor
MGRSSEAGIQKHIKLFNPREEVKNVLEMVGFDRVFEMHTNREQAVNSF